MTKKYQRTLTDGQIKGIIGVWNMLKRLKLKSTDPIRFSKREHGAPGYPDTWQVEQQFK